MEAESPARPFGRTRNLLLIASGLAALVLTSLLALPDSISGIEEDVFRFFNDWPDWLEVPGWPFMQFGALAVVPLAALVAWFTWRAWRPAAGVMIAGGLAWLLAKVVKAIIERGRPAEYLGDVNLRPDWSGLGFVSGHAAIAAALALVLSPFVTRPWRIALWTATGLTLALRMYTGAHLPLDMVGGAALGVATAGIARLAIGGPNGPHPDR